MFKMAGRMILQGLIGGIDPGIVIAKIRSIAHGAVRVFKSVLGIHSPSRVFAGLGGFMMQGLTNGIAGSEDGPMSRLRGLSRKMTGAIPVGTMATPVAAPAGPMSRLQSLSRKMTGAIAVGTMATSVAAPAGASGAGAEGVSRAAGVAAPAPITIIVNAAPNHSEVKIGEIVARKLADAQAGQRNNRGAFRDEDDY
jgi:hypothetical protein